MKFYNFFTLIFPYGERRNSYWVVVERSEGKRLLGKHRRGREYNIKFDLQEIGWGRGLD